MCRASCEGCSECQSEVVLCSGGCGKPEGFCECPRIHKRFKTSEFALCGVNMMKTGETFSPFTRRVSCPGCALKIKEREAMAHEAFAKAGGVR